MTGLYPKANGKYKTFTCFFALVSNHTYPYKSSIFSSFVGAWRNHYPLNEDAITFAEVLRQEKGYYTGKVGHLIVNSILHQDTIKLIIQFVSILQGIMASGI